ncbi:MAG: VOC family protein [Bacteroidales bacterium]|nr:VOC family protein [Bacteroidales bacterium]
MKTYIKSLFINLPVRDLNRTRAFWTKLGFGFNEEFSDDKAICLVLNEGSIYAMLITYEYFRTFTNRPVSDGTATEVLLAIEVDRKEKVDEMIKTAMGNGGKRYRDPQDHGWMYYDSFEDPDGHQWEVIFMDNSKIPVKQKE